MKTLGGIELPAGAPRDSGRELLSFWKTEMIRFISMRRNEATYRKYWNEFIGIRIESGSSSGSVEFSCIGCTTGGRSVTNESIPVKC